MTEQAEGPVVRVSEGDGWETRTTCGRTPRKDREREPVTC